ncbi:L-serine ammonia-lyase, iron-sulfur-dependent, subunit alpha [Moorella naiadis]|uniref:L-serine ammonia-lyase, iron-sulfur-dependent, subunit alpha n=1 Tax=Moorella naiadis (nom. illeg.) TaxID=3093670 RepID=UPI003D9CA685
MIRKDKVQAITQYLAGKTGSPQPLTLGAILKLAGQFTARVSEAALAEACARQDLAPEEVLAGVAAAFDHNLQAVQLGMTRGSSSFLLGQVGYELTSQPGQITDDSLLDRAVSLTLAAQVGNHLVGLAPCAGTGDACVFSGLTAALLERYPAEEVWPAVAVLLKVGSFFRAGKTTTGCNMEGLGAGASGTAAALVELAGGGPREVERAVVLALSPTIGVPCTPRVMVPGLCATHIGGALMLGQLAARLATKTDIPVNVPIDVMLALAAKAHQVSARTIVPEVIRYMEAYFKSDPRVDRYIEAQVKDEEEQRRRAIAGQARAEVARLAELTNPLTAPFGEVVVGGSSQAVGSPTNTARIAHTLAGGAMIKKVLIELYPELFARRAINIPGILMGAVYGASTADSQSYHRIMDELPRLGIQVEIKKANEPQLQRVTIETSAGRVMVDARNRGGGRLALVEAVPSLQAAREAAQRLGIVVVP